MADQVKPGTRCECRDLACKQLGLAITSGIVGHATPNLAGDDVAERCTRDAVRMAKVRMFAVDLLGHYIGPVEAVPMCAACADWHEKGAAR